MNIIFLTAEIVQRPGIGETLDKFGINIYDFISQAVCFLILAYVLHRFVFKPIMRIVDQRQKEAEETLNNTNKIQKILKETEDTKVEIIRKAREQAEKLIMETKADIDLLRENEMIRTEQLSSQMLAKAKEESLLSQKKIKTELKNEIAEMIVRLTGILTEKSLSGKDKDHLIESALKAMYPEISPGKADTIK